MDKRIRILEDIFKIMSESKTPDQALDTIVHLVTERFPVDVCSVYLYDKSSEMLVLSATKGLSSAAVGNIAMPVDEGLTGLVIQQMAPVFVVRPARHKRYKYYQASGEEAYQTFLGLPLVYHQNVLGVLVIQTIQPEGISEKDIPGFSDIAAQISAITAYTGLLADLEQSRQIQPLAPDALPGKAGPPLEKRRFLKGRAVTPNFGRGYAHYLPKAIGFDQVHCQGVRDTDSEIDRLGKAFDRVSQEIHATLKKAVHLKADDKAILEAHLMLLHDEALKDKIKSQIKSGLCAEFALKTVILDYVEIFHQMEDPYLWERGTDVEDMGRRVLSSLIGRRNDVPGNFSRDTIIVAEDISAVDLVNLRQPRLKGIVLTRGAPTSHAVILAKSLEIPIVIGVHGVVETIREDDFLIIDSASGIVFIDPPEEILGEYERLSAEKASISEKLADLKNLDARSLDGFKVKLGANIGLISDMELVQRYGADHIGLYRTEFPFLIRKTFPSEEEQIQLYSRIIEHAAGKSVTIRTIDIGGDKFSDYLDYPKEANPFLGWRSIRVSLDHEAVFRIQLRAILRASIQGPVRLLVPMITSIEEIKAVRRIWEDEQAKLDRDGIAFSRQIPIGAMLEVPALILTLERLLAYVDFISVGTNDLVQYLLAVDRNNEKVAYLYDPLHPAVISAIHKVVTICRLHGKAIGICGESATNLRCAYLYIGMGVNRLSMAPAAIPSVKQMIRQMHQKEAETLLEEALTLETTADIVRLVDGKIKTLRSPDQ